MTYGNKVKELREKANMTLEECSKKWKIGKTTLFRIEKEDGTKIPKKQLLKIAEANNLPIEYFTTSIYDEYPPEVIKFLISKESKKYVLRAYYSYMADKTFKRGKS